MGNRTAVAGRYGLHILMTVTGEPYGGTVALQSGQINFVIADFTPGA